MVEYLDIVDESDRVIGRAEKEDAHQKKLLHRFVHVLILNRKGELLLQRRGKHVKRGALLLDASVGGHVSSGQGYEEAARREMQEELGVDAPLQYAFDVEDRSSQQESQIGKCFITQHDGPFATNAREVESVAFLPLEKVQQMIEREPGQFTGGFRQSFEKFLRWQQNGSGAKDDG